MRDKQWELQTDRKAIADIFADFYEELYASQDRVEPHCGLQTSPVPPFTCREVTEALKSLKSKKCADTAGIRAEMLKKGGEQLLGKLLELYNHILAGTLKSPASWKHSVISVIHKSGDAAQPQNYRPICIIPVLYKLFSKLMNKRLYPFWTKHNVRTRLDFETGLAPSTICLFFRCCRKSRKSSIWTLG